MDQGDNQAARCGAGSDLSMTRAGGAIRAKRYHATRMAGDGAVQLEINESRRDQPGRQPQVADELVFGQRGGA